MKTITHYEIIDKLGAGGMGVVYKARDINLDRLVALKFLTDHGGADADNLERFVQEARAASAIDHPNICTVYEIGKDDHDVTFIAMAYYAGRTLRKIIEDGPLPFREALHIAVQIAEGLASAHHKAIFHRDIKPENIIVTNEGVVKIVDFGLAKISGANLTRTGISMGTLGYASPAQLKGDKINQQCDIWSLGVVLYELVSGKHPFKKGDHPEAVYFAIMNDPPAPLSSHRDDLPATLQTVVDSALAKDPAERYQHMEEFQSDLKAIDREGVPAGHSQPVRLRAGRSVSVRKALISAVLLGALLLLAGFFVLRSSGGSGKVRTLAVLFLQTFEEGDETKRIAYGMTEQLISKLSAVDELRVIALRSVMKYRDTSMSIADIGKELQVQTVMDGTLRRDADSLRVTIQLINVQDQLQIWSNEYQEAFHNVFQIQSDIAQLVSKALKIEVLGHARRHIAQPVAENFEAYQLYLRGKESLNKMGYGEERFRSALHYFEEALALDSSFALAYTGVADSYYWMSNIYINPSEAMPKASHYARTALTLDPSLPQAYASLARVQLFYEWNWVATDSLLNRALRLNPSFDEAYHLKGMLLASLGRFETARHNFEKAMRLDPVNIGYDVSLNICNLYNGQYEEAIRHAEKIIALDSTFYPAHNQAGMAYIELGQDEKGIAAYKKATELAGFGANAGFLGHAYAIVGQRQKAESILDRINQLRAEGTHVAPLHYALIYLGLNQPDMVFKWLDIAYEKRSEELHFLKVDPRFKPIHADPRYQALLRKMNLDRDWDLR